MKKKFISAVLFGAMVSASTSTFVSCKDYDDDINGLQGQITTSATDLQGMVDEKVNNLTTEINSLKTQDAALQTALTDAKTELAAAIEEAKNAANTAEATAKAYADVQAAAAQVAAIEAAQANIEEARKVLQAGIDDAKASIEALNSKVATQEETISGLLDADAALQAAINTANGEIESAKEMATAAQQAADAAQSTANDNAAKLAELVTSLDTVKKDLDSQISVLGSKVDDALKQIAANKADVEAQLATVNSLIESNTAAIGALQEKDSELLELITKNTTDLTALSGKLAEMETKMEANLTAAKAYTDSEVAALKAALGADIEAVKTDLAAALVRLGAAEKAIGDINAALENQDKVNEGVSSSIAALDKELDALSETVDKNMETITANIGKIAGQVEELQGTVGQHTTQIGDLQSTMGKVQEELAAVNVTASEAKENISKLTEEFTAYVQSNGEALKALETKLNSAVDEAVTGLGTQLREELATAVSDLESKISGLGDKVDDLEAQIKLITGDDGTVALINEHLSALDETTRKTDEALKALETTLTGRLDAVDNEINEIWKQMAMNTAMISQCVNVFNDELGKLCANLSKQLKGIVFSPKEYYQGIEAIGVWSFNYKAITGGLAKPDLTKNQVSDKATDYAKTETSVVPVVKASYFMNPSNASVDTVTANVKKHYSYILNNAAYTRAAQASDISIDSVRFDEETRGMFNVFFSMKNASSIEKIPAAGDGKVDVAALRYNYSTENGDTVVTSDFAALKEYEVKDFIINKVVTKGNVDTEKTNNHLAATAADAVNGSYPTLEIAYNNAAGINLDEWINVHYNYNAQKDQLWGGQKTVNEKKFRLKYELIGYKASDSDNTNESQHATIERDSVLKVHGVNGEEGSRKIIGRTPLVRVTLVDGNSGDQIAAVGYILVKITDVSVAPVVVDDINAINNGYTVDCEDNTVLNNVRAITWLEVEDKVLGELDMSKDEFEANYTFDVDGNSKAVQYEQDKNGKFNVINPTIGSIVSTSDDESHETNVLKWTVGNQQAYDLFVTGKKTSVSVWVKFKPNSTVHGAKDVYVKLTWTPATVNKAPEATILDDKEHKKVADWHAENSREAGFKELHIQVGNATDPAATCEYASMVVENTFNKKPLDIIKDAISGTYSSLANATEVSYKFAANQAITKYVDEEKNEYTVSVNAGGTQISAGSSLLATINPMNGQITMAATAVAKAIINNYGYENGALAKALTFTVVVDNETCEPAEDLVKLNNNTFNVKVIKPVFITGASIGDMSLNDFSSLTQKLSLDFVDFNGYDPQTFWDKSNQRKSFWDFYEVKSIELDSKQKIQTNYTGYVADVDENDFTVKFTEPTGQIRLDNMGSVTLTQKNMSRANDFEVYIPITVSYKWGTLHTTVTVKVSAASGNAAKRH